ncbi:MAG: cytochrome C [Acetobacteraceae bacterium]
MQIFAPRANTIARLALASVVGVPLLAIAFLCAIMYTPYITRQNIVVPQVVPFSHAHHVGELGIDCRYCHTGVEQSRYAGLPPTETCMTCHSQLWTNAPMLAPVRQSLATGVPLQWKRVNRLPDYAYFDHSVHITNGVGCETCHGVVDRMPLMRQAAPLTMGWCLSCHRDPAPHLRPEHAIFDTEWTRPPDQAKRGQELMKHYGIHNQHLTDCSVCHR